MTTIINMRAPGMIRRVKLLTTIRGLKLELGGIKLPRNANSLHQAQHLLPAAKIRTRKQAFVAVVDAARREFGYVVKPDIKRVYDASKPKNKTKPARKVA